MATLYEYYNTGADSYTTTETIYWKAQTFTPSIAHKITSVKLRLFRVDSPGTLTVSIKATDINGQPTGADLCSGTTNGNTLPTGSPYEWREITLGVGYDLIASTKYAIVIRALNGDNSNFACWITDQTSPTYTGGNFEYSSDSGSSWTTWTFRDFMFEEWGIGATTQAVGEATMTIAGSLLKQTSKATGGSLASAGGLHYYMVGGWKKAMGGASMAIAGGMSYDFIGNFKRAMGGGLISIAGSLARRVLYNTGRMSITMKFHDRAKTMRFNTRSLTTKLHKRSKITRLRM